MEYNFNKTINYYDYEKLLIILFICSPLLLIGQSKGAFTIKLNEGLVYDSKHTKNDVFEHTSDVYTTHDGTGKAQNGIQLSTGYSLNDNLLIGLSFMSAKIEASNGVEYTQGKFTETNMFAEYGLFKKSGFGLFAKAGYGGIFYETDRFLESDGGSVPTVNQLGDDKSDGTASKFLYGMGMSYKIYDAINVSLELTRNVVYDDGFDGWNEDEWREDKATDRYVYASIGVSYTFLKKKKDSPKNKSINTSKPIVTPKDPVQPAGSDEIAQPVEEVVPSEGVVEPVEEVVPSEGVVEPVEEVTPSEGVVEPVEEVVPSEGVVEPVEEVVPSEGVVEPVEEVVPSEGVVEPVEEWLYYTVQNGDTGGVLLQKLGCTKEELCKWNNLNLDTWNTNSGGLYLNQKLRYKK